MDAAGRRYRLQPIPRTEATKIDDAHVRTMIGAVADLDREDGKNFYIRLYEPPATATPPPGAPAAPSPGEPAAPALPEARAGAFRLVDFGSGLPRSGQWREGFGIGDVNRDGHPDIVFPPARKSPGAPVIFLGDGRGNWTRWRDARFPQLPYDYGDAQVADFDGDGIADIALAMHYRGVVALLGDGKGNFRDGSEGLAHVLQRDRLPEFSSRCLRAIDANGDGRTDLVAVGEGPVIPFGGASSVHGSSGVILYENLGGGRWCGRREAPRPDAPFGSAMAVGDFDADGRLDLAIATGVIGSRQLLEFGAPEGGWRAGSVDSLPSDGYLRAIAAADLDGDGVDDLVVGGAYLEGEKWVPRLDAFLSRDKGRRWEPRLLSREDEIAAIAAGPLAGSGSPIAIIALTTVGKLLVFLGDARGTFVRVPVSVPETGCSGTAVQLADLDGDGRAEIVAAFGDEGSPGESRCPSQGMVSAMKMELGPDTP